MKLEWTKNIKIYHPHTLIIAAASGDLNQVKKLATKASVIAIRVKKVRMFINIRLDGETALMAASRMGHLELVTYLFNVNSLRNHYEIMNESFPNRNAFLYAVEFDHLEIVKFFYEKVDDKERLLNPTGYFFKTQIARRRKEKMDELEKAIGVREKRRIHEELCRLNEEENEEILDKYKYSAFRLAAQKGALNVLKFLYEKNPESVNYCDNFGQSPLLYAVECGQLKTVEFLWSKTDFTNSNNETPLMMAIKSGHLQAVEFLCETMKADIYQTNQYGQTALIAAITKGHLDIIKYLFDKDPNTAINGTDKIPPAFAFSYRYFGSDYSTEALEFLYQKTKNDEIAFRPDDRGWNALHSAVNRKSLKIVKMLCGGDYNDGDEPSEIKLKFIQMKTNKNEDAFTLAINKEQRQIYMYLKQFFNRVEDCPKHFMLAILEEDLPTFVRLLPYVEMKDEYLTLAIRCEEFEMTQLLYQSWKERNAAENGHKWLLRAARSSFEIFKFIFDDLKNEEIAFQLGDDGGNALHIAADAKNLEIVKFICGQGEQDERKLQLIRTPVREDVILLFWGRNAYEIAARFDRDNEVAEYLEQFFKN